jgi:hypothetical protein
VALLGGDVWFSVTAFMSGCGRAEGVAATGPRGALDRPVTHRMREVSGSWGGVETAARAGRVPSGWFGAMGVAFSVFGPEW